jgi:hypothetical protein
MKGHAVLALSTPEPSSRRQECVTGDDFIVIG